MEILPLFQRICGDAALCPKGLPLVGSSDSTETMVMSQRVSPSEGSREFVETPFISQGVPSSVRSSETIETLPVSQTAPLHGGSESVWTLLVF